MGLWELFCVPSVLGKDGIGPQMSLKPTEMGTFTISSSNNEVFSFQIQGK